jgi:hypothetical protein
VRACSGWSILKRMVRRSLALGSAFAALSVIVTSCSLSQFCSDDADCSGVNAQSTADASGGRDGDSTNTVPLEDGSSPAGDAERLPDGAPGTFCARATHGFCSDFESGPLVGVPAGWTNANVTGSGFTLEVSGARAKDGVRALHVKGPARASGAAFAVVEKSMARPWKGIRLEYDVYWAATTWKGTDSNIGLSAVKFTPAQQGDGVSATTWLNQPGLNATVQRPSYDVPGSNVPIKLDDWNHLVIVFNPVSSPALVQMSVNGSSFVDNTFNLDGGITTNPPSPGLTVTLGFHEPNDGVPAAEAYFDNVTIDDL